MYCRYGSGELLQKEEKRKIILSGRLFKHKKNSPPGPGPIQLTIPRKWPTKECRIQETEFFKKVFAFGSVGKYKMCRREAISFYSDS